MRTEHVNLLIDFLLVTGFGIQHSVLAAARVKKYVKTLTGMTPLAWRSVESVMNICYVLFATALWQRTTSVVWWIDGWPAGIMYTALAASWLWYWYLHLVEYDCGLAFGSTTFIAKHDSQLQPQLENWAFGSRRWIRFPVHTAFFGMFLLFPHMTSDLFVFGIAVNVYNVIGSILYDIRLFKAIPDQWKPYARFTGLIWPPVYRSLNGARDIHWPQPRHWANPASHTAGALVGILLGAAYYLILGPSPWGPIDMAKVLITSVLSAIFSGALVGICRRPTKNATWAQNQTNLATSVALASATGICVWVIISVVEAHAIPTFGTYLPMWFTVQYLGHVAGYFVNPSKWRRPVDGSNSAVSVPNHNLTKAVS